MGFGPGLGVDVHGVAAHPLVKRIAPRIMTAVGFNSSPKYWNGLIIKVVSSSYNPQ